MSTAPATPVGTVLSPASPAPAAPVKVDKFKSFLDKLGADFEIGTKKALQIETALAPGEQAVMGVLSIAVPQYAPAIATFQGIAGEVIRVQQIATAVGAGSGTGPQKLIAAIPGVEGVIMSDPLLQGKTIANLPLYNSAIAALTSSIADLLSALADPAAPAPATT